MRAGAATRVNRHCFLIAGARYLLVCECVTIRWQGFEIPGCSVDADLSSGAICDHPCDGRPEPMLLLLLFLKRPDSMITGDAVGVIAMQRDQFVRLTSDAFTIRLSMPPPLRADSDRLDPTFSSWPGLSRPSR